MVSPKKLVKMARKWQQVAMSKGRRVSSPETNWKSRDPLLIADKGHFVVYTVDRRRFVVPLWFLCSDLFQEMFRMSEDEFGLSSDGPITMPCDAESMEYIVSLVRRGLAKDLEKALLSTVISGHCTSTATSNQNFAGKQVLVCG